MDMVSMRKHMEEIRTELSRIEKQREALQDILQGYESWFELPGAQQLELNVKAPIRKGTMSFPKGLREVLRQAGGEPLMDTEIWERMQRLGVRSNAKNPVNFVSLHSNRVPGIEKTATRTYRWVGVQETE